MKKITSNRFFALIIFVFVTAVFFYPIFLKGLIPFPGDLLLSEYQPWRSTSYNGIAPGGVPNKAQYFDSLRQMYPWKTFTIKSIKDGFLPLWNPHNFSGSPLFANFQSAVFFPLNIFYFLLPEPSAWTLLVILQPFFCLISVYILARRYKLSKIASIFSAISYSFCLYQTSFLQYNIMGHFMYLAPISLLGVEFILDKKLWGQAIISGVVAISGFAGHAQLFAGVIVYILLYGSIRIFQTEKNRFLRIKLLFVLVFFTVIGICISAVQLLPGIELISQSARVSHNYQFIFNNLLISPWQFILYLIPDLFGNPATKNYLIPFSYPSKAIYIGIAALYFAIFSFFVKAKSKYWKAIIFTTFIVALTVFLNPVSLILYRFNIPFLSSSSPSNFIFLISLGLCLMSGFGLDNFLKKSFDKSSFFLLLCLWIVMGIIYTTITVTHTHVVKNNFVYSNIILFVLTVFLTLTKISKKTILTVGIAIIILSSLDLFYFFHKFNPFVPKSYLYPQTTIGNWIKENSGINRFWGYGNAAILSNFATEINVYSPDGYDPLYPKTYGKLIQASVNGKLPKEFTDQTRSDASIVGGFGQTDMTENKFRLKVLSLMGVKYILDKTENGSTIKTFPSDLFKSISSVGDFKVLEYKNSAPRFFLTTSYKTYKTDEDFSNILFDTTFNPTKSILLNNYPGIPSDDNVYIKQAKLVSYQPNRVIIKTISSKTSLLFLSDSYYPGWQAFVDNKISKIYPADYAFRAIIVPIGMHTVEFKYAPMSFVYGLSLSAIGVVIFFCGLVGFTFWKRN